MTGVGNSIRLRLFLMALVGIAVALSLAGYGLTELFGRYIDRRLAQELDGHIGHLAGNLKIDPQAGSLALVPEPADPRFGNLYSGLYWQVRDETRSMSLRSRSLWDAELPLGVVDLRPGDTQSTDVEAPEGGTLKLRETRIVLPGSAGEGDRMVRLSAGISRAESDELISGFARDLMPGLAVFGLALLVGAWVQSGAGMRPVARVGAQVQAVRDRHRKRLDDDVPVEIRPLVDEVNSLLERQETDIRRAQDRAADLAHGFKTPLTALGSDIARLRALGQGEIADDLDAVAIRMRRAVERELVRARERYRPGAMAPVQVVAAAGIIAGILKRIPAGEQVVVAMEGNHELAATVDRDDLNEVLGNLMENAVRHARSRVLVTVVREGGDLVVDVDDDGRGAVAEDMARLTARGLRHDEKGGAAGLGLGIVADILAFYEREIAFLQSPLGGLRVRFRLPAA